MRTGIVSYGVYVPRYRLRLDEIRSFWGNLSTPAIREKAFPGHDEDPITMAVEASRKALSSSHVPAHGIRAIFLATSSGPYDEKPNVSTLAAALSGSPRMRVVELGGSPRAGGLALLSALEFCQCWGEPALAVASDAPLAHPSSALEHGLGAGAVAFVVAPHQEATWLEAVESFSVETFGERFRRRGDRYLQDLELRQEELSASVLGAVNGLLQARNMGIGDFDFLVLPDPDGLTPARLASQLGASQERLVSLTPRVGDAGAAGVLMGLAHALDAARAGQRILVVSYGSGADAMIWSVGRATMLASEAEGGLERLLGEARFVDYGEYLRLRGFLSPRCSI